VTAEDLRVVARRLVEERSPTATVRAVAATPEGVDWALWEQMAAVGWLGLWVDERFGGAGRFPDEMVVVLAELGRALAGAPFLSTALLGAAALGAAEDDDVRNEHLPQLVAGRCRVAVALTAAFGGRHGQAPLAEVRRGHARLRGACRFVADAHVADLVVVHAIGDDRIERLYLLPADHDGVGITVEPTVDETRRLCRIEFDGVDVADGALLVPEGRTAGLVEHLVRLAAVGLAADSAGGGRRALETTVRYTKDRSQFGRPIGSFQAIKHRCADMYLRVEAADTTVGVAAAAGLDDQVSSSVAKSCAADAYASVVHDAVLCHGAIGAMWEHDLHLYLKRAKLNQVLYGSSAWHRRRIVDGVMAAEA